MNKSKLVESLSAETGFNKRDIIQVLEAFRRTVVSELCAGEKLQWSNFGTFTLSERDERAGINPQTKEKIILPRVRVPRFKPGKNFKELVNKAL